MAVFLKEQLVQQSWRKWSFFQKVFWQTINSELITPKHNVLVQKEDLEHVA